MAVEGNRFLDVSGVGVCLLGAAGAVVRGNVFEGTHPIRPPNTGGRYGVDPGSDGLPRPGNRSAAGGQRSGEAGAVPNAPARPGEGSGRSPRGGRRRAVQR